MNLRGGNNKSGRLLQRKIIGIFPHRELLPETAYLRQVEFDLDHLLGKGFGFGQDFALHPH